MAKTEVRIIKNELDDFIYQTESEIADLIDEGWIITSSGGMAIEVDEEMGPEPQGFVIMAKPPPRG